MKNLNKLLFLSFLGIIFLFSCTAPVNVPQNRRADSLRTLAEAYMRQGNYIHALKELLKAEDLNPRDPAIHNDLGLTYMARGRKDLAVTHFSKALDLNPSFAGARNNLGAVYLEKKEWDKAISCFKVLSDDLLYETPHYALSNMGLAYFRKGEYGEAEKYYSMALAEKSGFMSALLGLGRTYTASSRPAKAVDTLGKALAVNDGIPAVYLALGKAFAALGDDAGARENYNRARELDSGGPVGLDAGRLIRNMGK